MQIVLLKPHLQIGKCAKVVYTAVGEGVATMPAGIKSQELGRRASQWETPNWSAQPPE
jgi:hypothetical protein